MRGFNTYYDDDKRVGFGVWLILILLLVASGSISAAIALMTGIGSMDALTISYCLVILVLGVIIVGLFFKRHKTTPKLIIAFLASSLLYFCIINIVMLTHGTGEIDYFGMTRLLVQSALIIPYLLLSDRVKEVFANG